MSDLSLGPGRDYGGSLRHRPLIVTCCEDAIAIGLGPFPSTAKAFLRKLPSTLALRTPGTDRLAAHLAVGAECHLVFDIRCRGGERLTGKKGCLDFVRRKCSGKSRRGYRDDGRGRHEGCAHRRFLPKIAFVSPYCCLRCPAVRISGVVLTASMAARGQAGGAHPGRS